MVGRVVGRLTVLERAGSQQLYGDMSAALWRCRCRCGSEVVLPGERLRRRNGPRSCGCLRRELGLAKLERVRAARMLSPERPRMTRTHGLGHLNMQHVSCCVYRTLPPVPADKPPCGSNSNSSTRDEAVEAFARCWLRKAC